MKMLKISFQTGKQLFYRHFDYVLGKIIPHYVQIEDHKTKVSTLIDHTYLKMMKNAGMIYEDILQDEN